MTKNTFETHPSYGLLRFSRVTHGGTDGTTLFGSAINHHETIRMHVKPAKLERHLNQDYYYDDGVPIIEVEMSYAQFAEAITAMNMGSGVPVTIRSQQGNTIESPTIENKRIQYENELQDKMKELGNQLQHLTAQAEDVLLNKKTINKADREMILKQLAKLHQEIDANVPFIAKMFNQTMDGIVHEAKMDVEAFTQNKLNTLGIEKLEELKLLGTTNKTK